ncbi:hypothetical protein [Agreia sp.]|uniref:hypothetical protein n=1 Tax=Agreia sp. TaxID=1872416 RepID=UPI0035BC705D
MSAGVTIGQPVVVADREDRAARLESGVRHRDLGLRAGLLDVERRRRAQLGRHGRGQPVVVLGLGGAIVGALLS